MLDSVYGILGLASSASDAEVKKRFRQLAIELHPDRMSKACDAEMKVVNESRFQEVTWAYGILTDEDKRIEFMRGRGADVKEASLVELEKRRAVEACGHMAWNMLFMPLEEQARVLPLGRKARDRMMGSGGTDRNIPLKGVSGWGSVVKLIQTDAALVLRDVSRNTIRSQIVACCCIVLYIAAIMLPFIVTV